jgi:spore coat protein A, manganese oxidase
LPRIESGVTGAGVSTAEIPVIVQDKIFVNGANIGALDPTWPGPRTTGSLWYAHVYEKARWKMNGNGANGSAPPPDPSVIPEFFGDTMLANGTVYPKIAVEPKRYRIRFLNACNARFLNLHFTWLTALRTVSP